MIDSLEKPHKHSRVQRGQRLRKFCRIVTSPQEHDMRDAQEVEKSFSEVLEMFLCCWRNVCELLGEGDFVDFKENVH